MKNDTNKLQKAIQRKEAISQGFFDGRFSNRVIPNKKKQEQKRRVKASTHSE